MTHIVWNITLLGVSASSTGLPPSARADHSRILYNVPRPSLPPRTAQVGGRRRDGPERAPPRANLE